jgi:hypothetical protein
MDTTTISDMAEWVLSVAEAHSVARTGTVEALDWVV